MRQFVIDDLSKEEHDNLDTYLKKSLKAGGMEGMYWLAIPPDLLGPTQHDHDDCGPFYFGFDLAHNTLTVELLVRSEVNLHCSCISYATTSQREFLLKFLDTMLDEEKIR